MVTMAVYGEAIDLSTMDYDTLLLLKQYVELELRSRPETAPFSLIPGCYSVGKDIKPGDYYVYMSYPDRVSNSYLKIYTNKEEYDASKPCKSNQEFRTEKEPKWVTLEDGYYIEILYRPLWFSFVEVDESERLKFSEIDGTLIPTGTYLIGRDIPAGSYKVYPYNILGVDILVYSDEDRFYSDKSYSNTYASNNITLYYDQDNEESYCTLMLSDGNILSINNSVIMKKATQFSFN